MGAIFQTNFSKHFRELKLLIDNVPGVVVVVVVVGGGGGLTPLQVWGVGGWGG